MKTKTDNTQDNKVSSHTPGEWRVHPEIQRDTNMCSVPYYEVSAKGAIFWLAQINATQSTFPEGQAKANAELIASAPTLKAENEKLKAAMKDFISEIHSTWLNEDNIPGVVKDAVESFKKLLNK